MSQDITVLFHFFIQAHHSSEELNLTTALRQPVLEGLGNYSRNHRKKEIIKNPLAV